MTEPKPTYAVPQAAARSKLARRRVLINELVSLEGELLAEGVIKRPSIVSRRMIHGSHPIGRFPRRVDMT